MTDRSESKRPPVAPTVPVDFGWVILRTLVLLVTVWLLAMPWVPGIQQATMQRFHLRTPSFAVWAMQQPIPAMYNLANRYEVYASEPEQWREASRSDGSAEPIEWDGASEPIESRYINHFPTRLVTFANTRYRLFASGEPRWLQIHSAYRGEQLTSRFVVRPGAGGGIEWERVGDSESAR